MDLRLLRYFVAVVEERHFGRAAVRLRIAQPSLSRAIQLLERDLGSRLLERSAAGVATTAAGKALYDGARTMLAQAAQLRAQVSTAGGPPTLTVGSLAGVVEHAGAALVSAFRERHPDVVVRVRESDFADPGCGLRAGLADVAVTLAPFDTSGLRVRVLRSDPVAVVLRADDPLAGRASLATDDLACRTWFRFPEDTDTLWSDFWTGTREGPVVRTAHECLQAVRWNGAVGLIPTGHDLPDGLVAAPLIDHPPCQLVLAWKDEPPLELVRSLVAVAATLTWQ